MDPYYSDQDVVRCDLCKTAIVEHYCDFCHVNLCKLRIGEHTIDNYSKHTIVPFELRRSTLIYPKCDKHPSKACELHCKDCNIFLCSQYLALKQHNKEHELSNLAELFIKKRKHIQKDKTELEKKLLPVYKDVATELEDQISNLEDEYKQFTTEISKHREELHKEIDDAMNQREEECRENKMKHHDILRKQLDEIKQSLSLMQEELHALDEMKISNEVSPTILFNSKNHDVYKLPPKLYISMPIFIPKKIETADLYRLIGKIIPLSTTVEESFHRKEAKRFSQRTVG